MCSSTCLRAANPCFCLERLQGGREHLHVAVPLCLRVGTCIRSLGKKLGPKLKISVGGVMSQAWPHPSLSLSLFLIFLKGGSSQLQLH